MTELYKRNSRRLYTDSYNCFKRQVYVNTEKPMADWYNLLDKINKANLEERLESDIIYFVEPDIFFSNKPRKRFKI